MRFSLFIMIISSILLSCNQTENGTSDTKNRQKTESSTLQTVLIDSGKVGTIEIISDSLQWPESPYRIPRARVKTDARIMFSNGSGLAVTLIIPKADILFGDISGFKISTVDDITYLFIQLSAHEKSPQLIIGNSALVGEKRTVYPYSVYIPAANAMAEGSSSPEIIVDP